jgi:tetratricopeptide (TPR) repeat protein
MKKENLFCLIIVLALLAAYSNSMETSFHHDDVHTIVRNPFIKDLAWIPQFFLQPQTGSGVYSETSSYRPLLMATFALNYHWGGLSVFGYHLFNFGLHALCALFVYFITLRMFRFASPPEDPPSLRSHLVALLAALVFGLHPVQTESVTYITGRSSLLISLFYLGSFYAYLQYSSNRRIPYLAASLLSYACALLVKETAVTLLAVLLLFHLLFPRPISWRTRFSLLLPHFLLSIAYLAVRLHFFGSLQYGAPPVRPSYEHWITQFPVWVHYLGTLFAPLNLNFDYDFPVFHSLWDKEVMLSLFLLLGVGLVLGLLSRSNRLIGFWALWFAINLAPTNSFIVLEDLASDRWLYLPSVGFAVVLAYAAGWMYQAWVAGRSRAAKILFFFLCSLLVEWYGVSTLLRNFTFTNDRTLWEDVVAKSPQKARAHNGLGVAFSLEGRLPEAEASLRRAINLAPAGGQAYINLGYVYMRQGRMEEALATYEKAIPLNPRLQSEIYNNLGLIYAEMGRMEDGEKALRKSIEIRPHHAAPYHNLGSLFERQGNIDLAIEYYETAAKLAPDHHLTHEALGILYEKKGWNEKSREALDRHKKYAPR